MGTSLQIQHLTPTARRGLSRLMLRLPDRRGQFVAAVESSIVLDDLFEIYEFASAALDRFRGEQNPGLIEEYAQTCREIEELVVLEAREALHG